MHAVPRHAFQGPDTGSPMITTKRWNPVINEETTTKALNNRKQRAGRIFTEDIAANQSKWMQIEQAWTNIAGRARIRKLLVKKALLRFVWVRDLVSPVAGVTILMHLPRRFSNAPQGACRGLLLSKPIGREFSMPSTRSSPTAVSRQLTLASRLPKRGLVGMERPLI